MTILSQLSSQTGDKTEQANRDVAALCLDNPILLEDIAAGLAQSDADLVGDCAEVMTLVADARPELVVPYAEPLLPLLRHRKTRARWESSQALALIARWIPDMLEPQLPIIEQLLREDSSTIVHDYLTTLLGNYASAGPDRARNAFPLLQTALVVSDGKHAGRALDSLGQVAAAAPELQGDILALAQPYLTHGRGVVEKAAKKLVKAIRKGAT